MRLIIIGTRKASGEPIDLGRPKHDFETEEKEILDKKRKLESLIYQSHIQNDKKRKRKKTLRKTHLLKKVLRK